ncbi:hypothetical protein [Buttiauxella gaviniae]|uniref:hypothetical protein n=1 Tax=Buttiauxella gaviniae TaxID=82990 RepID=UPI0007E421C5|nr:hypothetical protein [Buttiauxella gaviniae]
MKKILVGFLCLLPLQAMAISNSEIVQQVTSDAKTKFFPEAVKVSSISDVKFFPEYEDSSYARIGNVCGKVIVTNGNENANIVFIAHVTEKSNVLMVDKPVSLYDMGHQADLARDDLSKRCK